jgi:hypothetical protein
VLYTTTSILPDRGLVLLVAMIGAIVLTLRQRRASSGRHRRAGRRARAKGAIELVKVKAGGGALMMEIGIGLIHYLTVAAILFTLGVFGIFLNRKNVIIILMSIELILLAVNINLVAFSAFLGDLVGPGLRAVRPDRRRGRGRHRPGHPRRLLPQPRLDRGRRHQHDEGLTGAHDVPGHRLPAAARRADRGPVRPRIGAARPNIVTTGLLILPRRPVLVVFRWFDLGGRPRSRHRVVRCSPGSRPATSSSTGRCASTR